MGKPQVPDEEFIQVLSDGGWHHISEFFGIAERMVSIQVACRFYRHRYGRDRIENRSKHPFEDQIVQGRRYYLQRQLRRLERKGKVEKRGISFEMEFRLKD